MKRFFYVFLFFLLSFRAFCQETNPTIGFGDKIIVGTNVWYYPDDNHTNYKYLYQEILWNKNIAVSLNKNWYVGVNHFDIWAKGGWRGKPLEVKEKYNIIGAFTQYQFRLKERDGSPSKTSMLFEGSIHYGDRCTCGVTEYSRVPGLVYWGLGLGFDWMLPKNFSFEFSFHNYQIFNNVYHKFNSTQFVLGLNYTWNRNTTK